MQQWGIKTFRKAAEKCFVSQPTLSGQLKKLEIYLGVQLVERNTRSVFLTPIGEEIVKTARTILADAASIEKYGCNIFRSDVRYTQYWINSNNSPLFIAHDSAANQRGISSIRNYPYMKFKQMLCWKN